MTAIVLLTYSLTIGTSRALRGRGGNVKMRWGAKPHLVQINQNQPKSIRVNKGRQASRRVGCLVSPPWAPVQSTSLSLSLHIYIYTHIYISLSTIYLSLHIYISLTPEEQPAAGRGPPACCASRLPSVYVERGRRHRWIYYSMSWYSYSILEYSIV